MASTLTNKIYAAQYNSCIYESSFGTISMHRTYEGAEKVVKDMKAEVLVNWTNLGYDNIPDYEQWRVHEYEILE